MSSKMGRPKKYPLEQKKAVVDQFFVEQAAENGQVMTEHGVYVKLAKFAQSHGVKLEAYDFSKDPAIRDYIATEFTSKKSVPAGSPLVYQAINLEQLSTSSRETLLEIIKDLDIRYENLYRTAAVAIDRYESLHREKDRLVHQMDDQTAEMQKIKSDLDESNRDRRALTQERQNLRRLIKKEIQPRQAEVFFNQADSTEARVEAARPFVETKMGCVPQTERMPVVAMTDDIDDLLEDLLK